jgi:predicted nucleic acid-binding protein
MLIIDASVAVQWYVSQPNSAKALEIARSGDVLSAPDLILAEAGNAFWQSVRAGLLQRRDALDALSELPKRFDFLHSAEPYVSEALEIAISLNHPIYDCFYLALARRERAPLVTADRRLAAAAQALASVEVQLLAGV